MACFLLWMFNKSWCFCCWGKLTHELFFILAIYEICFFFWPCLLAKWLIRDRWILLSFVTLGFPLKSPFNMATNPSGPSHLYTQSKWQYPRQAVAIFFVILGLIMWGTLVVRWAKFLFSKLVQSIYFTWFMAVARELELWNGSWNWILFTVTNLASATASSDTVAPDMSPQTIDVQGSLCLWEMPGYFLRNTSTVSTKPANIDMKWALSPVRFSALFRCLSSKTWPLWAISIIHFPWLFSLMKERHFDHTHFW